MEEVGSPKKPKKEFVGRPAGDLRSALEEQLLLLLSHCEHYDNGERAFAKPITTILRILLHETRTSKSLLGQLGLRQGEFNAIVTGLHPRNMASECDLVAIRMNSSGVAFLARTPPVQEMGRLQFDNWWNDPVLKGGSGITMSRRDVVIAVADMDGGAHVDPSVEKVYESFRSGELLGWNVRSTGRGFRMSLFNSGLFRTEPMTDPQYACIRAIAHELLSSLSVLAPWSLPRPYLVRTSSAG